MGHTTFREDQQLLSHRGTAFTGFVEGACFSFLLVLCLEYLCFLQPPRDTECILHEFIVCFYFRSVQVFETTFPPIGHFRGHGPGVLPRHL